MFINLIVLSVNNLEISKDFYSLFDFQFIKEQHDNSPLHYSCEVNGLVLELYPSTTRFPVEQSVRLGFQLANFELIKEKLILHHIDFTEKNNLLIVQDPDGRKIFLSQK